MSNPLQGDELERAVVAAYKKGIMIREIRAEFGISQSTVYWILEKHGEVADRAQRRRRLTAGAERQADALYELVRHQDTRIQELETQLAETTAALAQCRKHRRKGGNTTRGQTYTA